MLRNLLLANDPTSLLNRIRWFGDQPIHKSQQLSSLQEVSVELRPYVVVDQLQSHHLGVTRVQQTSINNFPVDFQLVGVIIVVRHQSN